MGNKFYKDSKPFLINIQRISLFPWMTCIYPLYVFITFISLEMFIFHKFWSGRKKPVFFPWKIVKNYFLQIKLPLCSFVFLEIELQFYFLDNFILKFIEV